MASKQPFKFINVTQKLTVWSIRINKFLKHRLLSKRKNVLLISQAEMSSLNGQTGFHVFDNKTSQLSKINRTFQAQDGSQDPNFESSLTKYMSKTWQITKLKSFRKDFQKLQAQTQNKKQDQSKQIIQKKQQTQNAEQPSTIAFSKFNDQNSASNLQKYFLAKKKYFDAIIILPQQQLKLDYPQIQDEQFATGFIDTFEQKIMQNLIAYRYAHKFLNTSGAFIQSASQYDFLKKTDAEKQKQTQKALQDKKNTKQEVFSYAKARPPSSKQILQNTICYLGVVVGDRDHTDLNTWTLVSLSEEASRQNPSYVAKMYYDWADGQQLPMPGSFTIFKKKIFQDKKQLDYVQYL